MRARSLIIAVSVGSLLSACSSAVTESSADAFASARHDVADVARTFPLYTESFSSNALPSALETSGATPTFTDGLVRFGGTTRHYLRTKLTKFADMSFTAEVTVNLQRESAFFGLGAGQTDDCYYDEPSRGPVIYGRFSPTGVFFAGMRLTQNFLGTPYEDPALLQNNAAGTGTHRLRMTWNAETRQFTMAIHANWVAGRPFKATTTIGPVFIEPTAFGESGASVFIGGSHGLEFDDLVIRPGVSLTRP